MRTSRLALGAIPLAVVLAACSSTGTNSDPTPSTSTSPLVPANVAVKASKYGCETDVATVPPGPVKITATGFGPKQVAVAIYAPKDGRWTKALGLIPTLLPGTTKSMVVELQLGAYEISCYTPRDDHRSRLTAV